MAEKDIGKMNLGELISELLSTRDKISAAFNINEGDSKAGEMLKKREELKNYENQIYAQLDKKEKKYDSYKHPPVFK